MFRQRFHIRAGPQSLQLSPAPAFQIARLMVPLEVKQLRHHIARAIIEKGPTRSNRLANLRVRPSLHFGFDQLRPLISRLSQPIVNFIPLFLHQCNHGYDGCMLLRYLVLVLLRRMLQLRDEGDQKRSESWFCLLCLQTLTMPRFNSLYTYYLHPLFVDCQFCTEIVWLVF